jgi:hypothetical protein
VLPESGVNPRCRNGYQKVASRAATAKSAASASCAPIPAAQPRTAHTTGSCSSSSSGISRPACTASRRWMLPVRGLASAGNLALRATMSNPLQKSVPAPVISTARRPSSVAACSRLRISAASETSVSALRCAGRSSVSRSTPPATSAASPSTAW